MSSGGCYSVSAGAQLHSPHALSIHHRGNTSWMRIAHPPFPVVLPQCSCETSFYCIINPRWNVIRAQVRVKRSRFGDYVAISHALNYSLDGSPVALGGVSAQPLAVRSMHHDPFLPPRGYLPHLSSLPPLYTIRPVLTPAFRSACLIIRSTRYHPVLLLPRLPVSSTPHM